MEPVSSILGGWLVGKVADAVWSGASSEIQSRLKESDLTEAIATGEKAIQEWEKSQPSYEQHLFFSVEEKASRDYLTQAFTDSTVQAELQRPLKQEGEPQLEVVCAAFRQLAKPSLKLNGDRLKPWLEVFLKAYVARTSYFVKVRVAQQDYLTQLANWFDDVRFLGVAVESGEIEQAEKLAQIFVMQDVLEEKSMSGADFFLH